MKDVVFLLSKMGKMCFIIIMPSSFSPLLISVLVEEESQNLIDHFSSQVDSILQLFHYFHLKIEYKHI